jgi:hypothetical protein
MAVIATTIGGNFVKQMSSSVNTFPVMEHPPVVTTTQHPPVIENKHPSKA